jgi:hypothetical protein
MPRLSCWFIRASLIYLAIGFTFGGLLLANKGVPFYPLIWRLLPSHYEFLLVGWIVELAMGMIFWIMPRFSAGAARGNEALIWASFWLINAGIWLAAGASLLPLAWLGAAGRILEAGAAAAFGVGAWPRIKAFYG